MLLRLILIALCAPSAGILLLMVYTGVGMDKLFLWIFLPALIIFLAIWLYVYRRRRELHKLLLTGLYAGLIGTICYDLIRIPAVLMGQKVFAPISMYGMWVTDGHAANAFTDSVGWSYHFSNGLFFAIAYLLVMRSQKIIWAILYALALETIFVFSPFGELVGIRQKPIALVVAYMGHIFYGYPIGYMAQHFDQGWKVIHFFRKPLAFIVGGLIVVATGYTIITFKGRGNWDGTVVISENSIQPPIIRIDHGEPVKFSPSPDFLGKTVTLNTSKGTSFNLTRDTLLRFDRPGLFHLHYGNNGIIVISEPVYKYKK